MGVLSQPEIGKLLPNNVQCTVGLAVVSIIIIKSHHEWRGTTTCFVVYSSVHTQVEVYEIRARLYLVVDGGSTIVYTSIFLHNTVVYLIISPSVHLVYIQGLVTYEVAAAKLCTTPAYKM